MKNSRSPNSRNKHNQMFSICAPAAQRVQLVGDFTHWQSRPISLAKHDGGVWTTKVGLEPGEHRYRFLVDGEWQNDPDCSIRVPNPFGSQDSVVKVPEETMAAMS